MANYDLPVMNPYSSEKIGNPLPGIEDQRSAIGYAGLALDSDDLPTNFPLHLWEAQQRRYQHNWKWFTGEHLAENQGKTRTGETIYKFPLRINAVSNFSRKHALLLFGEISEHAHRPLVNPQIRMNTLVDTEVTEVDKKETTYYENILRAIWQQSNCNSIMLENGILSQFLGGSYFVANYVPWRTDLAIPITITNMKPDFVLPIWSQDDQNSLLEAYIMYRIPSATAQRQWGIASEANKPFVNYIEHWTQKTHSIYIDNAPLIATYLTPSGENVKVNYNKAENIFGFVPVFYIPRMREGNFYGSDIVVDIEGIVLELNGRYADSGTALKRTANRKWFGRNLQGGVRVKQFDNDSWYIDLGMENPSSKNPPNIWPEDPPKWSEVFNVFNERLWAMLLRQGNLTPVAFGEDEGSQRSAMTLAIRFWPTSTIARAQRVFWSECLNSMDRKLLIFCWKLMSLGLLNLPKKIDLARLSYMEINQDWLPMVPRDREQTVNEVVLLSQTNRMSLERALQQLGDVKDEDAEIERIWNELKKRSEMETAASGEEASTMVQTPTATDGLDEE